MMRTVAICLSLLLPRRWLAQAFVNLCLVCFITQVRWHVFILDSVISALSRLGISLLVIEVDLQSCAIIWVYFINHNLFRTFFNWLSKSGWLVMSSHVYTKIFETSDGILPSWNVRSCIRLRAVAASALIALNCIQFEWFLLTKDILPLFAFIVHFDLLLQRWGDWCCGSNCPRHVWVDETSSAARTIEWARISILPTSRAGLKQFGKCCAQLGSVFFLPDCIRWDRRPIGTLQQWI